jgi:hypothetical protein
MKIIFIADVFVEDGITGGGELNNDEFIKIALSRGIDVFKVNSRFVTPKFINENIEADFIVANFIHLSDESKNLLISKTNYAIYEHDHKYLDSRNPSVFENFKAPKKNIVNYEFYKSAKAIFCQSKFHSDIVKLNLELDNIHNLEGNIWPSNALNFMLDISKQDKEETYSIMQSNIPHKNTADAIRYCQYKKYPFQLIESSDYYDFLRKLGKNKYFVFFPKTPETLSRIVCEARMMGVSVIANESIGAIHEPWFSKKGKELVDYMIAKRDEIPNTILEQLVK